MAGYFELKAAAGGKFSFNLKAANHQVILTSEAYTGKAAAEGSMASVKRMRPTTRATSARLPRMDLRTSF